MNPARFLRLRISRNTGIQSRILFIAILPSMLIASALTAFFTLQSIRAEQRVVDNQASQSALVLSSLGQYALISGNRNLLDSVVHDEQSRMGLDYAAIFDANSPLKSESGQPPSNEKGWPQRINDSLGHLINGRLYHATPILLPELPNNDDLRDIGPDGGVSNRVLGIAVVGLGMHGINAQKYRLLATAALLVITALLITAIMGWRLSRRLTEQVQHISSTVSRITRGELSARLEQNMEGELGRLEQGINQMAEALHENRARLEERIRKATASLAAQKEEAERANIAKSKFFAAASHDLRQPLHALMLFVGALKERAQHPEMRTLVEHIESSVEAMEMLFDSLLDISRLDAGAIEVERRHFPVGNLFDRLTKQFKPQAEDKRLKLRVRPCEYTLYTDPVLLERILLNLVSNGIRYTDRGGVMLGCRKRGKNLALQVWDTGRGIPDHQRDMIFREFVQLDNPERDRGKGLGLGLAIVARLCKLLDLPLSMRSRSGRGSVFTIEVPLGSAAMIQPMVLQPSQPGTLPIGLAVLIDDENAILRAMEELFDNWHIDLITARSLDEAMRILDETGRQPDVVISDYRLPGPQDGVNVLNTFRDRYGATLPAIILTGDTSPESILRLNQSGYTVLHKPLRPARLRSLLTHLLTQGAQTQ